MTTFETKEAARQQRIVERADRAANRARNKTLSQLKVRTLSPAKYRDHLKKLEITIVGAAAYFGISRRQAQRIAAEGPIPKLIEKVLKLLLDGKLTKEDLQ
jgi:hypothetical protein